MKKVFVTSVIIICIVLLGSQLSGLRLATGTATLPKDATYAYTLNDWLMDFYNIYGIQFPEGVCTEVAQDLYNELAFDPTTVTEDFSTKGRNRISSIMYGIEENVVGSLEMIHGIGVIQEDNVIDSKIYLTADAVVKIPKFTRISHIELVLNGVTLGRNFFEVKSGRIETPTLHCEFFTKNNQIICDCSTGFSEEFIKRKEIFSYD